MIKTPLTRMPVSRVAQHKADVAKQFRLAKRSRRKISEKMPTLLTPKSLLVWSYAAGALFGSRRKTTKVVQRQTKTIKSGASFWSVINTVLSVMALKYKVQRAIPSSEPKDEA